MKTPVHIDLFHSSDWHAITTDVLVENGIIVTRGRGADTQRVAPTTVEFDILNVGTYKYSPRNPMSELYGLIGRNTPMRAYTRMFLDDFDRTVASGWGFDSENRGWTLIGAGSGSSSVSGGVGIHTQSSTNAYRLQVLQTSVDKNIYRSCEARVSCEPQLSTITGGAIEPTLVLRFADTSNYYQARASIAPGGAVTLSIRKLVANVETTLVSTVVAGLTFTGQALGIAFVAEGACLAAKIWDPAVGEPYAWQVQTTDTDLATGTPGVRTGVATGNTNIPVTVHYDDFEIRSYRAHAEVEKWSQRWTTDGVKVWAPIKANGILRRLSGAGSEAPAHDSMYRWIGQQSPAPYAWWPMDSPAAESGGLDVQAAYEDATLAFPTGVVAPHLSPGLLSTNRDGFTATLETPIVASAETAIDWVMRLNPPASGGDAAMFLSVPSALLDIHVTSGVGEVGLGSPFTPVTLNMFDGAAHHWRIVKDSVDGVTIYVDGEAVATYPSATGTLSAERFRLIPWGAGTDDPFEYAVSHVVFWTTTIPDVVEAAEAALGHPGETAVERATRLCAEEGISFTAIGGTETTLGPQRPLPLTELLFEAADADGGILYETRHGFGLAIRTHSSLYSQTPVATLDYTAGGEAAPNLEPDEDTSFVQNDITVSRTNGGFVRKAQATGNLNIQEPSNDPQGVGRYPITVELNLESDSQLPHQATWRRHLGTWDEPRYPTIPTDVTAADADDKTPLINRLVSADLADRLVVESPPIWTGPDEIDQLIQGYVETLDSHHWTQGFNAVPARPYNVVILNSSTYARLGAAAELLTEDLDTTETGIDVSTFGAEWGTADLPYDVVVNGEQMTVSAVSGSAPNQSLTVTRSVNGVIKSHAEGAVQLALPARLARR